MALQNLEFTFNKSIDAVLTLFTGETRKRPLTIPAPPYLVEFFLTTTRLESGLVGIHCAARIKSAEAESFYPHYFGVAMIELEALRPDECRATLRPLNKVPQVYKEIAAAKAWAANMGIDRRDHELRDLVNGWLPGVHSRAQMEMADLWHQAINDWPGPLQPEPVKAKEPAGQPDTDKITIKRKVILDNACKSWVERGRIPGYDMTQFLQDVQDDTKEFFTITEFKRALQDAGRRELITKIKGRWRPKT